MKLYNVNVRQQLEANVVVLANDPMEAAKTVRNEVDFDDFNQPALQSYATQILSSKEITADWLEDSPYVTHTIKYDGYSTVRDLFLQQVDTEVTLPNPQQLVLGQKPIPLAPVDKKIEQYRQLLDQFIEEPSLRLADQLLALEQDYAVQRRIEQLKKVLDFGDEA